MTEESEKQANNQSEKSPGGVSQGKPYDQNGVTLGTSSNMNLPLLVTENDVDRVTDFMREIHTQLAPFEIKSPIPHKDMLVGRLIDKILRRSEEGEGCTIGPEQIDECNEEIRDFMRSLRLALFVHVFTTVPTEGDAVQIDAEVLEEYERGVEPVCKRPQDDEPMRAINGALDDYEKRMDPNHIEPKRLVRLVLPARLGKRILQITARTIALSMTLMDRRQTSALHASTEHIKNRYLELTEFLQQKNFGGEHLKLRQNGTPSPNDT
jgi:hypothetical protein